MILDDPLTQPLSLRCLSNGIEDVIWIVNPSTAVGNQGDFGLTTGASVHLQNHLTVIDLGN